MNDDKDRKKDHHFVPIFFQRKFYQFKPTKHGFYYELRYNKVDLKGTPKTRMWLENGYSIYDQLGQFSDEVENIFGIVEAKCAPALQQYINIKHENFNFSEELNKKIFFLLTLQIIRMPHFLYKFYDGAKDYARLLLEFIKNSTSLNECNQYINPFFEEKNIKHDPPLIFKDNEYNTLKELDIQDNNNLEGFFELFTKNNHNHHIGKLIGIDGIKELFSQKNDRDFSYMFDEKYQKSLDSYTRDKNNIAYMKLPLILLQTLKEIIIAKEPSFILPMAVLPDNIDNPFHVPISPKIVLKFFPPSMNSPDLPIRKTKNNAEIQTINNEFIDRTLLLKTHTIKNTNKPLYEKLSLCIPCEYNNFDNFIKNYLPDNFDQKN